MPCLARAFVFHRGQRLQDPLAPGSLPSNALFNGAQIAVDILRLDAGLAQSPAGHRQQFAKDQFGSG